jgi:hypothetical protein
MLIRYLLPTVLLSSMAFGQSSWLEFNAGASENSSPLVQYNGKWDSFLTFDVELRGLLAETVTVDSQDYLRFSTSPGTVPDDSVGYPELPVVRRLVWIPDDSDITVDYSASCCEGIECLPVYPTPLDSLVSDSTCTPYIGEYFRQDSAAYASEEWYPDTLARLVGEFRLRDLRVGIVDVYPVQYLASEDSLRVWSDIEIALGYDTAASWPTCDLGCYEGLIGDRLLGYRPDPLPWAPIQGLVSRPTDLVAGPNFVPDFVILVAAGLDGWWVDTLAHHRADLDGFDVAIARTDSVLSQFGGNEQAITPDITRDFTEAMWDWGSAETKRPSYLLMVGDHEVPDSAQKIWFLPTQSFFEESLGFLYANDSWYAYFGESRSDSSLIPDMMVGRLPARRTDNLQDMIQTIRDFEAESSFPAPDSLSWRRYITRLQGCPPLEGSWLPGASWTDSIRTWCGYNWDNVYCGDCDAIDYGDHSTMTSIDWDTCLSTYLTRGQQIAFYIDHGIPHNFSAGMDYRRAPPFPWNYGLPDSVFSCWDVDSLPIGNEHHGYPFLICCCCGTGSFDHTVGQHYDNFDATYCHNSDAHKPPLYDFPIDCLAERFLKNTEGGAIAVFASSGASYTDQYSTIGGGLIRAVLFDGHTRVGDAVAAMRLNGMGNLVGNCGLGRYNLLGDPAVDIGDRVKFRERCDLVISPEDIQTCRYPTMTVTGTSRPTRLQLTVRNAGAVESGEFDAALRVTSESNYDTTLTMICEGLEAGEEQLLSFGWRVPRTLDPPVEITVHATADPDEDCDDSWTPNNDASMTFELVDFYPNDEGFPIKVPGSILSPPLLADLDGDEDLEIVVIVGNWSMSAYDPDDPDEPIWTVGPYLFNSVSSAGGCTVPLTADIMSSTGPEIIVDTATELLVISAAGSVLCSYPHSDPANLLSAHPHTPVVADLITDNNTMEIALLTYSPSWTLRRASLSLLEVSGDSLVLADSLPLPASGQTYMGGWLCGEDLLGDSYDEILVSYTWATVGPNRQSGLWICDYNPRTDACFFADSIKWANEIISRYPIPAVGELAGNMRIAMSRQRNTRLLSPAYILDSGLSLVDSCEQNQSTDAGQVLCCTMADWRTQVTGPDVIISPSENQAFAWRDSGQVFSGWPQDYDSIDAFRPPFPAVGNLDNTGFADAVVSTRTGWIQAYSSAGSGLSSLGFPYILPAEIRGGFCIADIDGDENIELVFGTTDGYLHLWQLGSCDEYYSPWPQCQHDAARTGVLE